MPKVKLFDKDEALNKAMLLFWTKGYHGSSIHDLVEATGLSRSSLYGTFEDKHKFYVAALKHYQSQQKKLLLNELAKKTDARGQVETIFLFFLDQILKDTKGKGCFMVNTVSEMSNQNKELEKIAFNDFAEMEQLLYSIVKKGQLNGEISKKQNAESLAAFLFSGYLGFRITAQINPDRKRLLGLIKVILVALK